MASISKLREKNAFFAVVLDTPFMFLMFASLLLLFFFIEGLDSFSVKEFENAGCKMTKIEEGFYSYIEYSCEDGLIYVDRVNSRTISKVKERLLRKGDKEN